MSSIFDISGFLQVIGGIGVLLSLTVLFVIAVIAVQTRVNRNDVPHVERAAYFGCIDGRLVWYHFIKVMRFARNLVRGRRPNQDFMPQMAGGAVSLLFTRDAESAMGQLKDAHGVRPVGVTVLEGHIGCGKLGSIKLEQVLEKYRYLFCGQDMNSAETIFRMLDVAAVLVSRELPGVKIEVRVVKIVRAWFGLNTARTVQRPLSLAA